MSLSLENASGGNFCFVSAGLTGLSGAATTFSTGATTLQYSNQGKILTKAQVSGGTTPTTDGVTGNAFNAQAANTVCCYAWCLDASGNVKLVQGKVIAYTDTSANSTKVELPLIPATLTPIAYSVIKNGSTGSSWIIGTNNWNATGITVDTPVNLFSWPSSPPLTA